MRGALQGHRGAEIERQTMDNELKDKTIWLPTSGFQEQLLPKPPAHLMPSPKAMRAFKKELEKMISENKLRANQRGIKNEDALNEDFVSISCR